MPGSFFSSSIESRRAARDATRQKHSPGIFEPADHAAHLLLQLVVHLALRVVDRGDDQVLQHLDVVLRHDLGIDLDRLQLLGAVDDTVTMPPPAVASTRSSAICFCRRSCICCACFIICWMFMTRLIARGLIGFRAWVSGSHELGPSRSRVTGYISSTSRNLRREDLEQRLHARRRRAPAACRSVAGRRLGRGGGDARRLRRARRRRHRRRIVTTAMRRPASCWASCSSSGARSRTARAARLRSARR